MLIFLFMYIDLYTWLRSSITDIEVDHRKKNIWKNLECDKSREVETLNFELSENNDKIVFSI